MRTQYESKEDRTVERMLIQDHVSRKACKLPQSYGFDFIVHYGTKSPEVWEVKRRKKRYDTWFVSLLKLLKAQHYEALGIKAYALVEIEGRVYTLRLTETPYFIGWGGRSDRNDSADQEPMVHYKLSDMLQVVEGSANWGTPV
tara:strand:- start:74 stop:502 length:429 start_codon:yes stop_codon:yes gene_type:complete